MPNPEFSESPLADNLDNNNNDEISESYQEEERYEPTEEDKKTYEKLLQNIENKSNEWGDYDEDEAINEMMHGIMHGYTPIKYQFPFFKILLQRKGHSQTINSLLGYVDKSIRSDIVRESIKQKDLYIKEHWTDLDSDLLPDLIKMNRGNIDIKKLFPNADPNEIVQLSRQFGKIEWRHYNELNEKTALLLIQKGEGKEIVANIHAFSETDHAKIADYLIDEGFIENVWLAVKHGKPSTFSSISERTALALMEQLQPYYFMNETDSVEALKQFNTLWQNRSFVTKLLQLVLKKGGGDSARWIKNTLFPDANSGGIDAIYLDETVPQDIREASETYNHDIEAKHQRARLTHALSPREYADILVKNPALEKSKEPLVDAYDALIEKLGSEEGESVYISEHMRRLGDIVGANVTMRFANRPNLSRHDAFLEVPTMERLLQHQITAGEGDDKEKQQQMATIKKKFTKLLLEVSSDKSRYGEEHHIAHHEFNQLLQNISVRNIALVLQELGAANLPGINERIARLSEERFDPIGSWRGFKEYVALQKNIENGALWSQLNSAETPPALKEYITNLLKHPNISSEAITQFLTEPNIFLDGEAGYVDSALQQKMSPARMLDIPLGMTAENLRDTLIDGTLDKLQHIPPYERTYRLSAKGEELLNENRLREEFLIGIGKRNEGIKGIAKNSAQLFSKLHEWAKPFGWAKQECIAWIRGEQPLPPEADKETLLDILHNPKFGLPKTEEMRVRVRIGKKSDPNMVVAGNDTASCMPFGDGKTNVYTWGPSFSQLIVERQTETGEWRTMAQSVMLLSAQTETPASMVANAIKEQTSLKEKIGLNAFTKRPHLICDNIQPSPNEVEAGRSHIIEKVYETFFHEYLKEHSKSLGVNPSEVIVGKEDYVSGDMWSFPKVPNTFVPLAPISYSDNLGETSYRIATGLPAEYEPVSRPEVDDLKPTDIMATAIMEEIAYADNQELVFGLYDRQHKITGATIASEHFGDPKLNLLPRDANGMPVGYIMAYMERKDGYEEIYLEDMAVDRSRNMLAAKHAIKLLDEFLDRYSKHYHENEEAYPPIRADMRETTSYRLLSNQAEKLAKRVGLLIEIVDNDHTVRGNETFKDIRIFIGRTQQEITQSKERFAKSQENREGRNAA